MLRYRVLSRAEWLYTMLTPAMQQYRSHISPLGTHISPQVTPSAHLTFGGVFFSEQGTPNFRPLALRCCTFPTTLCRYTYTLTSVTVWCCRNPAKCFMKVVHGDTRTLLLPRPTSLRFYPLSVCSMCRPACLPRQLAVNLSRWVAKHQVDNRDCVSRSKYNSAHLIQGMYQGVYPGTWCTVECIFPLSFTRCRSLIAPRPSKAN